MVLGSRREMRGARDDSGSQWTFCSVEDKKQSADTEQKRTSNKSNWGRTEKKEMGHSIKKL